MNWKHLSLTMVIGLGMLMWPGSSYAQTPLDDCIGDFQPTVDQWVSEAVQSGVGFCQVQNGKAWVHLRGTDVSTGQYRNFNARFWRDGPDKSCAVVISRHPDLGGDTYYSYDLAGKWASKWNKYLKGEGCEYALSVITD